MPKGFILSGRINYTSFSFLKNTACILKNSNTILII